jgi:hypothetical protein
MNHGSIYDIHLVFKEENLLNQANTSTSFFTFIIIKVFYLHACFGIEQVL